MLRHSVCEANKPKRLSAYKQEGDAGLDVQAMEAELVPEETYVRPTRVAFKHLDQHVGIIKARSSLASKGLTIDGGVIDEGYVGEIKVILINRHKWLNAKHRTKRPHCPGSDHPTNNGCCQGSSGVTYDEARYARIWINEQHVSLSSQTNARQSTSSEETKPK